MVDIMGVCREGCVSKKLGKHQSRLVGSRLTRASLGHPILGQVQRFPRRTWNDVRHLV